MSFIEGSERDEVLLLPACLDDYISDDSPVRFIDEFVNGLDLESQDFVFPKEDSVGRGRPGYHPADLLKLYIYGYSNGIRSGRKLEKACNINLEVIWLLKRLRPDFKTICDFRKNNRTCFKKVAAEFTILCNKMKLISSEFIAVDGTIMKASNSRDNSWNGGKLKHAMKKNEDFIEKYLRELEEPDADIIDETSTKEITEGKLSRAQDRKKNFKI